jgi:PmbA protein
MLEFEMGDKNLLDVNVAKSHAQRLLGLLNKKQMDTCNIPLILHPEALSSLFSQSYVFSVSGENLFLKKSKFKIGEKVFDDKITITDDALTKGLFCTRPFDKEGTKSQKFNVIENGVFKNALYDNYYGKLVGKKSTGNAQRSVVSLPSILPNNIVIKAGNVKDVLNDVDKAIYVRGMLGVHTMNEATGDFSVGVMEGHYVEKGKLKYAVKDTMIAGNFFDLMNNVVSVGKKIEHSLDVSGGCYMPEILFKNVKVIGN